MRRNRWLAVCVLATLPWARSAGAVRAYYFALGTPGTASAVVSEEDKLAIVTDGGQPPAKDVNTGTGLQRRQGPKPLTIEGKPLLTHLLAAGVSHLVVVCSHPHADHYGGLVALVKRPEIQRFKQVDFVDSSADPTWYEGGRVRTLRSIYDAHWNAGENGNPPLRPSVRPAVHRRSARNRDAFQDIPQLRMGGSRPGRSLQASNFVYPAGTQPHEACVVMRYRMGRGKASTRWVDFDDAAAGLVAHFSSWAEKHGGQADVVVMPHHGSNHNSAIPALEALGPRAVIFTVAPDNRYGHPGIRNLYASVELVGPEHVVLTGGARDVTFGPGGVPTNSADDLLRDFGEFVRPRATALLQDLGTLTTKARGRLSVGDGFMESDPAVAARTEELLLWLRVGRRYLDAAAPPEPRATGGRRPAALPAALREQEGWLRAAEDDQRLVSAFDVSPLEVRSRLRAFWERVRKLEPRPEPRAAGFRLEWPLEREPVEPRPRRPLPRLR